MERSQKVAKLTIIDRNINSCKNMTVQPKKIINSAAESVDELIQGLLIQYPNRLSKLSNHHVLLKQDIASSGSSQVQILSGGGSGHEPSHAGWIGDGMLSGAILGGIFASPSVASILAAIRAASCTRTSKNSRPVLLIVKNYTGDRLNFGMACERANAEGIDCQMVIVADDCAMPRTKGITGARGVAGTVLVHKIAGAAAARGASLDEVASIARSAARRMGSLGIALDAVTVPGAAKVNDRLDDKTIEIGLGIHGEAGMRQSPLLSANEMAKDILFTVQKYGRLNDQEENIPLFSPGDDLCVLVNNLGGTSNFEMSILTNSVVTELETQYKCTVTRVFVGSFMTSFEMHGASITILNLVDAPEGLVDLLDADTNALCWPKCDIWNKKASSSRPSSVEIAEVVVDDSDTNKVSLPPCTVENFESAATNLIMAATKALAEAESKLTQYDTIVGDGDCGITMKRGAVKVSSDCQNKTLKLQHPVTLFSSIADSVSTSMGGTSGVLLELFFRNISSTLARMSNIGHTEICQSIQAGVDAVSLYGGAHLGSRTMLDALIPAVAILVETSGNLSETATKAKEGADSTASMKSANAGRSNYLSEDTLVGTPDPGAVAVAIVFEAIAGTE